MTRVDVELKAIDLVQTAKNGTNEALSYVHQRLAKQFEVASRADRGSVHE